MAQRWVHQPKLGEGLSTSLPRGCGARPRESSVNTQLHPLLRTFAVLAVLSGMLF